MFNDNTFIIKYTKIEKTAITITVPYLIKKCGGVPIISVTFGERS